MSKVNTLGARIALAMLSVITIGVFILGIIFFFTFDHMEHKLLEMLDSYAAQNLDASGQQNIFLDSESALIKDNSFARFSSADNIPDVIKNLSIGFHHDIEFNERSYHIAIKEFEGVNKYLVFDITDIETQEHILSSIILVAMASVLIIAAWVTYWLSRKVIQPVQEFAKQVGSLDPNTRNIRIADDYNDVEVGLIAQSFDRYMERLDGFVEREQSFTSTVSHELRTPLSVISTSAELLETNKDFPINAQKYVDLIKKSTNEMTNLISALLFLAREDLPNNNSPIQQTDITQLTHNIVETYKYADQGKNVTLTVSVDQNIKVNAPKSHVQIIISNLLNNALRHTKEGSVRINLNHNKLEVVDTGSGIDQETINHAFERGFMGKDSSGYGFGLYICKRLCDRYGWNISIVKNPITGSTASVSF
ncbi:MAG: sensor histidine kinase [Gammaproteobacteria bacterium]